MSAPPPELFEVRLIGVPVEMWRRASAHQQAVQREFDILMSSLPENSVPHRLAELSEQLANRFNSFGTEPFEMLREAADRNIASVDLTFRVPEATVEGVRQLDVMMDVVDEFCREGDLLTLAASSELVAFRRWFLGEFIRQIGHGEPPESWSPKSQPERAAGAIRPDESSGTDSSTIVFEGDLDLTSAGLLREEILARRSAGARSLTIDLTRVEFIDSVGLSLLVTAYNRVKGEGAKLDMVLPTRLRRVFEISGLIEVLDPRFEDLPTT